MRESGQLLVVATGLACVLGVTPARADDHVALDPLPNRVTVASFSAAVGALTYGELTAELAIRFLPRDAIRVGLWGFGSLDLGHCACGHAAAYVSVDYALRRADDVSVWLGVSFGPMFLVSSQGNVETGASALLALDVAVPLTHALSLDLIMRGGLDAMNVFEEDRVLVQMPTPHEVTTSSSPLQLQPLIQFAVGITWDFDQHSRSGL